MSPSVTFSVVMAKHVLDLVFIEKLPKIMLNGQSIVMSRWCANLRLRLGTKPVRVRVRDSVTVLY